MSYTTTNQKAATPTSTGGPPQMYTITTGATTNTPQTPNSSGYASGGAGGINVGPFDPIDLNRNTVVELDPHVASLTNRIKELESKLYDAQRGILTDDMSEELKTAYDAMKDLIVARETAVEIIKLAINAVDWGTPVHGEMLEYLSTYDDYTVDDTTDDES